MPFFIRLVSLEGVLLSALLGKNSSQVWKERACHRFGLLETFLSRKDFNIHQQNLLKTQEAVEVK